MTGAVGAGDTSAVEHERHSGFVKRDIHQHLVESTVDEGRVQRDHRMQPAERHPRRRRHRVLLGDTDVEYPARILLGETMQPGRAQHRGGDSDDLRVGIRDLDDLVGEHGCP